MKRNNRLTCLLSAVLCMAVLTVDCGSGSSRKEEAGKLLEKAGNLVAVRQYQPALELLERAVDMYPANFEIHRKYIGLLSRQGDGKAVEVYEKLLKEHPSDPLYLLCLSLAEEDRDRKAALIDDALRIDPENYWAHVEKARLMCDSGEPGEAVEILQKVVGTNEDLTEGAFLLARALEDAGRYSDAASVLENLRSLPVGEEIRNRATGELFSLKWKHEDRKSAQELAGELIETVNDPFLLVDIAYAMSETEEYRINSIAFFEKAIAASDTVNLRNYYPEATAGWLRNRSSKNCGFFGEGLGKVYLDLKRFDKAVPVLERARSDLDDPYSEVLLYLARAYKGLGRNEEALGVLLELLSRQTDDEAMSLLEELYTRVHGNSEGLTAKIEEARQAFWRQAPDFELRDEGGEKFSLASLKGKVVLLAFWFPT